MSEPVVHDALPSMLFSHLVCDAKLQIGRQLLMRSLYLSGISNLWWLLLTNTINFIFALRWCCDLEGNEYIKYMFLCRYFSLYTLYKRICGRCGY